MSDNIWDRFDWPKATTSTSSAYHRYDSSSAYHRAIEHERYIAEQYEIKLIKERMASPDMAEIDLRRYLDSFKDEVPQYMRSVMGDFEKQHEQEDVEEPQTVFHFDPKGIVDKWPEKEI